MNPQVAFKTVALKAVLVTAAVPHAHAPGSPPLTSHTAPNAARFKYHSGVSLHRAVKVIRRLQHLHRERRRAERRERLRVTRAPVVAATTPTSPSPSSSGLPACTWRPESGGSYTAVNPSSGAYGKYQVLPSTHAALCSDLSTSPSDQETCAGRIWQAQGPGAWVGC